MDAAGDPQASWARWFQAAADPSVDSALRGLFDRLDEKVNSGPAACNRTGDCCRFDQFGHRLYVTALEIAWVLTQVAKPTDVDPAGACVFQVDRLCTVHAVRPIGCRVFFCDRSADDWQHGLSEQFLADLRQLHRERNVEYRYVEWRVGLAEALRSA